MDVLELEKEALSLSLPERARLADMLLQSIDPNGSPSATDEVQRVEDHRALWLEEARRRDSEIDSADAKVRSAEDVFRAARARLG